MGQGRQSGHPNCVVGRHNSGLDSTVADSSLLLALSGEREEAVGSVQGEEHPRGAPHAGPISGNIGVREQP